MPRVEYLVRGGPMANKIWVDMEGWGVEFLGRLASRTGRAPRMAPHLAVGLRGEREALFELRRRGYTVVARRWKSSKLRGDLDLVAWEGGWLCFVEVKTRSERREVTPAEGAVDEGKRKMLRRMGQAYLRGFPEERRGEIPVRFDVVTVYLHGGRAEFEVYRGAFGWG